MGVANYSRFLSESITRVPGKQPGLREDEIYGVYLSWCLLNAEKPGSIKSLLAAMRQEGHTPEHHSGGRNHWPELSVTGPAVVDYILASQPSLV
ncbi:hypothetical protein QF047_002160 [Arthrobacter sp. W4I7]|nr:hypothetical protein [Arthrobacter sp. W4I7]